MEQRNGARRGRRVWTLCVLALLLTACGDDDNGGDQTVPPPSGNAPGNPPPQQPADPPSQPPTDPAPPSIGGTPPPQAMAGQSYAFQPTVSAGNDAGAVSFAVVSLPSWATFDSATGRISGTPGAGDIGHYQGITISATNDAGTDSLGPFAINVVDVAPGSVTLSWQPPDENEDGTPLTDLSGYRIHYGHASRLYEHTIEVDRGLTTYVVENLVPSTYYFAITALTEAGLESEYSNEATTTVDGS